MANVICINVMWDIYCHMQLGDPTITDHISSEYARLDFDGVDEFTLFFSSENNCIFQCMPLCIQ